MSDQTKETLPKAGFFCFSLGVLPCFHSVKKLFSIENEPSKITLIIPPRISWLTHLNGLPRDEGANFSQDLAPHIPGEGFLAFFFYALLDLISGTHPVLLSQEAPQCFQVLVKDCH